MNLSCKSCNGKLIDVDPSITLTSNPLRFKAKCDTCGNTTFPEASKRRLIESGNDMEDKLIDVWRKQFESLNSEQACQRDYRNPELYWNDTVQHQWEGFLMAKRSQPSVVLPSSKSFPSIGHPMDKLGVHGYELALSDVKSALTTAGIKYTIGE